jgi:hypothetical protein
MTLSLAMATFFRMLAVVRGKDPHAACIGQTGRVYSGHSAPELLHPLF